MDGLRHFSTITLGEAKELIDECERVVIEFTDKIGLSGLSEAGNHNLYQAIQLMVWSEFWKAKFARAGLDIKCEIDAHKAGLCRIAHRCIKTPGFPMLDRHGRSFGSVIDELSQLVDRYQLIGTARTVGELRELISMFPDETDFGFINQPLQSLFARRDQDGTILLGFQ